MVARSLGIDWYHPERTTIGRRRSARICSKKIRPDPPACAGVPGRQHHLRTCPGARQQRPVLCLRHPQQPVGQLGGLRVADQVDRTSAAVARHVVGISSSWSRWSPLAKWNGLSLGTAGVPGVGLISAYAATPATPSTAATMAKSAMAAARRFMTTPCHPRHPPECPTAQKGDGSLASVSRKAGDRPVGLGQGIAEMVDAVRDRARRSPGTTRPGT